MTKRHRSIVAYFTRLLRQFRKVQQKRDIFRIVDMEQGRGGKYKLVVQIVGKNITYKITPEEILADDKMLEGFSRQDVRNLTYLACQIKAEPNAPKSRILVQEFCDNYNRMMFSISRPDDEAVVMKSASEISLDKDLLAELSQEDAHMVGYTTATEQMLEEQKLKERLKTPS